MSSLTFLKDEEVPSGKAQTYSASRMSYILFALNDNKPVRCIASCEVIMDQYQDKAENPKPETIADLKIRFSKLFERGHISDPDDDFEGKDLILTTSNFSSCGK